MRKIVFLIYMLSVFSLVGQNDCFTDYMRQGKEAEANFERYLVLQQEHRDSVDYYLEIAIKSYNGALQLCDNLAPDSIKVATASLDSIFSKNGDFLKRMAEAAIKKQKESEARRLANLSDNIDKAKDTTKLELAFYAKHLIDTLDIDSKEPIELAFREAIQNFYTQDREEIATATFINNKKFVTKSKSEYIQQIIRLGDNNFMVISSEDSVIISNTQEKISSKKISFSGIKRVAISPDSTVFILGAENTYLGIGSTKQNTWKELMHNEKSLQQIEFAPEGQTFLTRFANNRVYLWDKTGDRLGILKHEGYITDVGYIDSLIITSSKDKTIKIWNSKNGKFLKTLRKHQHQIYSLDFSSDGNQFISFDASRKGIVWDKDGMLIEELQQDSNLIDIQFTPNKDFWLFRYENYFKLSSKQQPSNYISFNEHKDYIEEIIFSPNGKYILSYSQEGSVLLWNLQGKVLLKYDGLKSPISKIEFSPDGNHILAYDHTGDFIYCPVPEYQFSKLKEDGFSISSTTEKFYNIKEGLEIEQSKHYTEDKMSSPDTSTKELTKTEVELDTITNTYTSSSQNSNLIQSKDKNQRIQQERIQVLKESSYLNVIATSTYLITIETSLRGGPYHTFKSLKRLKVGRKVTVLENWQDKHWYRVIYNNQEGWAKKSCMELVK